ncbi:acyltransferase family protein [Novosphingobium olei]|uniref:Acyltransferase n=1 Tax=Novosphingobium olei TaxID=2728851 RepID=A0A7Y0GC16_9SPHN|nr:acyltransferase family protein [Novosphingobium olei]NML95574.1 acyltransferase [Novosphingobium olei]
MTESPATGRHGVALAPPASPAFRSDINVLRAMAIVAVMGFHYRLAGFPGGFAGVDVFFVVSGFLMTGIVVSRLEAARFSLLDFYVNRTLRIVPALVVVLAVLLGVGWFRLIPADYQILGKNAAMAALFASNLRAHVDYFGADIGQEWLLHTWSLSLEWQFYLLYPVVLLAAWKLGLRRWIPALLALGALASFAISLWLLHHLPIAAFYLLPSRAWELLAGGLVWYAPELAVPRARILRLAGAALLALTLALADDRAWPGVLALLPTLGTALILAAGPARLPDPVERATGWLGLASYSIYLWHWPLALWVNASHPADLRWSAAAIALSAALGLASYHIVEQAPGRFRARRRGALALVVALALVAAAGWAIARSEGLPNRFGPAIAQVESDARTLPSFPPRCFALPGEAPSLCRFGKGAPQLILVGDSHAAAAFPAFEAAGGPDRAFQFGAYVGCMPVFGGRTAVVPSRCGEFATRVLPSLARPRTMPVVLIASWQSYFDVVYGPFGREEAAGDAASVVRSFRDTACKLAQAGPTYALLPVPGFAEPVPLALERRLRDGVAGEITTPLALHERANAQAYAMLRDASRRCGLRLLDPAPLLCRGGQCLGSLQGRAFYRDTEHLSVVGARRLAPLAAQVLDRGAMR